MSYKEEYKKLLKDKEEKRKLLDNAINKCRELRESNFRYFDDGENKFEFAPQSYGDLYFRVVGKENLHYCIKKEEGLELAKYLMDYFSEYDDIGKKDNKSYHFKQSELGIFKSSKLRNKVHQLKNLHGTDYFVAYHEDLEVNFFSNLKSYLINIIKKIIGNK